MGEGFIDGHGLDGKVVKKDEMVQLLRRKRTNTYKNGFWYRD